MKAGSPARSGYTLVAAIVCMGIVAAVLGVLSTSFGADMKRTREMRSSAQWRQVVQAGTIAALAQADAWATNPPADAIAINLPDELAGALLKLVVQVESNRLQCTMLATTADISRAETIWLVKQNGQWAAVAQSVQ